MDYNKYSYNSRRNVVFANRGMASSTSPIASQIGRDVMRDGGNAMDAAVAMAMALPLVEPCSNGLGSDCFVQIWSAKDKKLYGLNGSGFSPQAISGELVRTLGYETMPTRGWIPTMVPGAPAAWAEIVRRFGSKSMSELAAPTVRYAREGFNIPVNVAKMWHNETSNIVERAGKEPDVFGEWVRVFTRDGAPYNAGDLFRNPDFADTLEEIAATDAESYYRGPLMKKIVEHSKATGGFFEEEDFTNYRPEWVEPISVNYRGYDVFEMPPNGHGLTVLMAMKLLEGFELGEREDVETYHRIMESIKVAYVDVKRYVADPLAMKTKVSDMLSDRYLNERRSMIGHDAILAEPGIPCGDTVYFCTADGEGNMVSFIQSNYNDFGSGIVIPGTGINLQDRGANFSLDPDSDNYLEGGKKSYHTIIPGFLMKDGKPVGPFGVMGGFMQPQGQVQVLVNTIDYGMNPQEALDCPRMQWIGDKHIQVEADISEGVAEAMRARGHEVEVIDNKLGMGRGQIIWRMDNGSLVGGTEPRADGAIAVL